MADLCQMVLLVSSFALSIVIGSYQGVELIGITAGEQRSSEKNIVKAVNGVIWRILIFYLGAIFVIVSVYPWNQLGDIGNCVCCNIC
ncbi:hypothetical protein ACVPOQ_05800 [Staphylococcus aureus]